MAPSILHPSYLVLLLMLSSPFASAEMYSYDVSGQGDIGYVYGEIEASSHSRDVEGYIHTEDGRLLHFEGEWTGKGEIDGYDEDGNYYELEVD